MSSNFEGGGVIRSAPGWYTPRRLVLFLCLVMTVVYIDRGAIGSNGVNGSPRTDENPKGSGIQGAFDLSNFEDGTLSSLFMISMLVASPIYSEAVHHFSALRLIGSGLLVWTVAVGLCTFAWNYYSLAVFRAFVGAGESAIVVLATPFIDDQAPPSKRSLWLGMLFSCIPIGYGLGYMLGGALGTAFSWRAAFAAEALLMLPFTALAMFSKPLTLMNANPEGRRVRRGVSAFLDFFRHTMVVLSHIVFDISAVGYTLLMAVLGIFSYWGARATKVLFGFSNADQLVGVLVAISGFSGTLIGGAILDRVGSGLPQAFLICGSACVFSSGMLLIAFVQAGSFATFIGPFMLTAISMFITQAPANAIGLWSVPADQRALAMSILVVCIHMLGDVPSPTLAGQLLDKLASYGVSEGNGYIVLMVVSAIIMFLAGVTFLIGAAVSRRKGSDYRQVVEPVKSESDLRGLEEGDESTTDITSDDAAPLLGHSYD